MQRSLNFPVNLYYRQLMNSNSAYQKKENLSSNFENIGEKSSSGLFDRHSQSLMNSDNPNPSSTLFSSNVSKNTEVKQTRSREFNVKQVLSTSDRNKPKAKSQIGLDEISNPSISSPIKSGGRNFAVLEGLHKKQLRSLS